MKEIKPAALKIKEACKYLQIGSTRLRELADLGDIPCRRLNRERYFRIEDLDRWLESLPPWVQDNGQNP